MEAKFYGWIGEILTDEKLETVMDAIGLEVDEDTPIRRPFATPLGAKQSMDRAISLLRNEGRTIIDAGIHEIGNGLSLQAKRDIAAMERPCIAATSLTRILK